MLTPVSTLFRTRSAHGSGAVAGPATVSWRSLAQSFLIPVLLLAFFLFAPEWLNARLHASLQKEIVNSGRFTGEQQARAEAFYGKIDFARLCLRPAPAQLEPLREGFDQSGVTTHFERLLWGRRLSILLNLILGASTGAVLLLERRARRSPSDLIRSYRAGWALAMATAFVKVLLMVPLLAYGIFELTSLAADRYFPGLVFGTVVGGAVALWQCLKILLRKIPLEFREPLSRKVTREEAPGLWAAVSEAARKLNTEPPDHILVGMKMNFYVTEFAVQSGNGRVEGRTLFLCLPLIKNLSPAETLAIVGHELGHFLGEDTRVTREFYPLRVKAGATMMALARAGWAGRASIYFLNFFAVRFGVAEREMSRRRELLADAKAVELTSAEVTARALVKLQVVSEALRLGFADSARSAEDLTADLPVQAYVREQLIPNAAFWSQLFEKRVPHPLDTHPPLGVRLKALGQEPNPEAARVIAQEEAGSAYAAWFGVRETLFAEVTKEAGAELAKARGHAQLVQTDAASVEGRALLARHFPELRWKTRHRTIWILWAVAALLVLIFIGGLSDPKSVGWSFLPFPLAAALLALVATRRHWRGELVLSASGLTYSGWIRPLAFPELRGLVTLRKRSQLVALRFNLKTRQPPIWKFGVPFFRPTSVLLRLGWFGPARAQIAEAVARYMIRKPKE